MRSARPLQKKSWQGSVDSGFQSFKNVDTEDSQFDTEIQRTRIPFLEFGVRYGILENLDLGIKYSTPTTLGIIAQQNIKNEIKYALVPPVNRLCAS